MTYALMTKSGARKRPEERAMLHRMDNPEAVGTKVIVADDDDELRALVVETLRGDGYTVVEARDGAELLSMLRETIIDKETRPDIVVTDVRMPNLSGLGVLEQLKLAHIRLPVVVMTGFAPESVRIVAKRLGAVGVLSKPFDVDDLRTAVMNARRLHN
jgi:CheY-like chemotaxis protein